MAAKIPMIAITIINSINVKPFCFGRNFLDTLLLLITPFLSFDDLVKSKISPSRLGVIGQDEKVERVFLTSYHFSSLPFGVGNFPANLKEKIRIEPLEKPQGMETPKESFR
jgi:hypothetical protein